MNRQEDPTAQELAYYSGHSKVTNPGRHADLLACLPRDINTLYRAANGLVLHFRMADLAAVGVSRDRLAEADSRYAQVMISRLLELDTQPLTARRPAERRLVGCCRDFTVLFLAMARAVGLAARARVGFASYLFTDACNDHEIAEVWDADTRRWRLVDPQLREDHRDPNDGERIDPTDVPRSRFLVAGVAWQSCKNGSTTPDTFMVHPDVSASNLRGWPYLAHNLVFDIAALNKREMLLWDLWGLAGKAVAKTVTPAEARTLDTVAQLSAGQPPPFKELRLLYDSDPGLRVPNSVSSASPTGRLQAAVNV